MGVLCLIAGTGIRRILIHLGLLREQNTGGSMAAVITGIVGLTVFAEYFSIFYRVGILAHLLMLSAILLVGWKCRSELSCEFRRIQQILLSAEGPLLVCLILITAFYTSRGTFHTDTGIYHAQAIRIIEEYGVVKGIGNLQLHFAYNSSYLVFAALFTMSWILPAALHTTTGFLAVLLVCYAVHGLFRIREHEQHSADAVRIAILIYYLTNVTGSVSPVTDYGTMYMVLYLLCAWADLMEWQLKKKMYLDNIADFYSAAVMRYSMLSVLSIFIVSMKLSAASMAILTIYPFMELVRKGWGKKIGGLISAGLISVLPYLIRNILISGWLLYPVRVIDLFHVEWKIPAVYLDKDVGQIKAWGRCLYDVAKLDLPLRSWVPVWWAGQQHYEQMLIMAQLLALFLLVFRIIYSVGNVRKVRKIRWEKTVFYLVLLTGLLLWFFTAPFIRYGLALLLVFPLCTGADTLMWILQGRKAHQRLWMAIFNTIAGFLLMFIFLCFTSWLDNYAEDDLVFAKHEIRSPYYLLQEPFPDAETGSEKLNGNSVYYSEHGEINSYYHCPSTCYRFMLDRSELIGDTIQDGFRAKQ